MEAGLALVAGGLVWLSCDLALAGGTSLPMLPGRLARGVRRHLRAWLEVAAGSPAVSWLLGHESWSQASRALAALLAKRGEAVGVPVACAGLGLGMVAASAVSGLAFGSPAAAIVVAASCAAAVPAWASGVERRRRTALAREMPAVLRTLSVAMGSGQTLAQAIDYVGSHEGGLAGEGFARASLRLRCGMSAEDALGLLAGELDAPGMGLLATVLVVSHRTGSPLRDLLLRSARLAERQGEFERLLAVRTAQVRLSVRIVCLLPVVMLAVLSLLSPDFQAGLATPVGLGCVALSLGLDGLALLIIRRLLKGVL